MVRRFKVSAQWMKACGKGDQPKTFDIENIEDFSLVTPSTFFAQMVHVVDEKGNKWLVAVGRGEFVEEPDAPATQADTLTIETASAYAIEHLTNLAYDDITIVSAQMTKLDGNDMAVIEFNMTGGGFEKTDKLTFDIWLGHDGKLYGEW
jgi:hypothetical protein